MANNPSKGTNTNTYISALFMYGKKDSVKAYVKDVADYQRILLLKVVTRNKRLL